MPGLMDLHSHTVRCRHATGTMEAYVERAVAIGLRGFPAVDPLRSTMARHAAFAAEVIST